jgi:hypothetical protein
MNQKQTIKAIEAADISKTDWQHGIVESVSSEFVKGYLHATISHLNGNLAFDDEEFREALLEVCGYDIWGDCK